MNFGGALRINKFACFFVFFFIIFLVYWKSGDDSANNMQLSTGLSLKKLLKSAIISAERGGLKVVEGQNKELHIESKGMTLEKANDPVTNADYASHCVMYSSLHTDFPTVSIISEEKSKDADCENQNLREADIASVDKKNIQYLSDEYVNAEDVTLWIDPLDATQEYTETLYQFVTTMVCVAVRGVPIIGVIHTTNPPQTYWAWNTKTTSDNILHKKNAAETSINPRIIVSRSHKGNVEQFAKKAFGQSTVDGAGGAGYKVMSVVNGTYDLYLHTTAIKKWDICAGNAIINTLNGKMTTLSGASIDYSSNLPVQNTEGLLVSLHDHEYFLNKLNNFKE